MNLFGYKTCWCIEWEHPGFGWVMAQTFLRALPPKEEIPKSVKSDKGLLFPSVLPCQVEILGTTLEQVIDFRIQSLIYVNPEPLVLELSELNWALVLNLSDGFWNETAEQGVIQSENNMAIPEILATNSFTVANQGELIRNLRQRSAGGVMTKITRASRVGGAYFVGEDIDAIIGKIQIYKVMAS